MADKNPIGRSVKDSNGRDVHMVGLAVESRAGEEKGEMKDTGTRVGKLVAASKPTLNPLHLNMCSSLSRGFLNSSIYYAHRASAASLQPKQANM